MPAPAVEPADPLAEWDRTLGLMARSDEDACAGIRMAWELEVAARDDQALSDQLAARAGFRKLENTAFVHWVELSRAIHKPSAETAMVTVGGVASRLRAECLDATSFVRWLGRTPSFTKTQPCTREALGEVMEAVISPALERTCVCNPPGPAEVKRLIASIEQLEMDPEPWRAWAEGWKTCPAATEPAAEPATPAP